MCPCHPDPRLSRLPEHSCPSLHQKTEGPFHPQPGNWEARRSFRSGDVTEGWFVSVLEVRRLLPAKWLARAGWLGCPRLILSSFSDGDLEKNSDFFSPSTGDREQSGLLCNQRLCPADNTRGINCPCPAQAPEEGLVPVVGL